MLPLPGLPVPPTAAPVVRLPEFGSKVSSLGGESSCRCKNVAAAPDDLERALAFPAIHLTAAELWLLSRDGQMPPGRTGRSSNSGSRFSALAANSSIMSPAWNMPVCHPAMWRRPSATEWSRV